MIEWVKQLTPEFYIVTGFLLVLFILLIIQIIRLTIVSRRLGTQDFKIIESISKNDEGELFLQITVSNQAFSTNNLNNIGFKDKSIIHVLGEVNKLIPPRNKHVETISMAHIESITIEGKKKFRKVRIYADNDLGNKQEIKAKITNKHLKRRFKENKKAARLEAKQKRFETGNYNFFERVGLILRLFGRPVYKFFRMLTRKTNNALKESEVRRRQKAEHDKIEKELNVTVAKTRSIEIEEESKKYNKTRETELELLKQQKLMEIETLKKQKLEDAFLLRKAEIDAINPEVEVEKHFEENPINYDEIDEKILKESEEEKKDKEPLKTPPKKEEKKTPDKKETEPKKPVDKKVEETKKDTKAKPKPKKKQNKKNTGKGSKNNKKKK